MCLSPFLDCTQYNKTEKCKPFLWITFSAVSYVFVRFFYDSSGKPIITRVPVPSCDVIVKLCPSFFKIVLQRYSPIPVDFWLA